MRGALLLGRTVTAVHNALPALRHVPAGQPLSRAALAGVVGTPLISALWLEPVALTVSPVVILRPF